MVFRRGEKEWQVYGKKPTAYRIGDEGREFVVLARSAWLFGRVLRSGGVGIGGLGKLDCFPSTARQQGKKNTAPDGSLGSCCGGSGQLLPTERSPRCVKPAVMCAKSLPEEPTDPGPFAHFSLFGGGFAERVRRRRSASLLLN